MNATELFLKDGKRAGVFFCEKCHNVAPSHTAATDCCQNYKCGKCGKDTGTRHRTICDPCALEQIRQKEQARFDAAVKITEWDGWIFDGSDFHPSLEEYLELLEGDDRTPPAYVWPCLPEQFVKADFNLLMEHIEENGYEDFDSQILDGQFALKEALKKFEEVNAAVVSYAPDYSRVLLLPPSSIIIHHPSPDARP